MKAIIAIILGAFLLSACNTMEGFGQDVQAGGKKIERSADEHK
ncbi:MAG TPA: entericidin A/B family lipoprotein [Usitatibacter sp.]|jgi:entericidin B|nr:entericidin A/B family lipoprotein [Usitatibacter sp.]